MNPLDPNFQRLMQEAARLTRGGDLQAATAAIQSALAGGAHGIKDTNGTNGTGGINGTNGGKGDVDVNGDDGASPAWFGAGVQMPSMASMPWMTSVPSMPSMASMPSTASMPGMPAMPDLPAMRAMPALGDLAAWRELMNWGQTAFAGAADRADEFSGADAARDLSSVIDVEAREVPNSATATADSETAAPVNAADSANAANAASAASAADSANAANAASANAASAASAAAGVDADNAAARSEAHARTSSASPHSGARFITGRHADKSAGQRDFKLFIPSAAARGEPLPLVVMLHGCTQNADDFAAGTQMNVLAEAQGFFVLYPVQSQRANPQRCWNWFKHNHQQRGRGEAALLAGMTRQVMAQHGVDAARVYVAGLSAGGAMAAILGQAYPELYAAVGVHSGLAAGAANDLPSALQAMNGGSTSLVAGALGHGVPTIVFHGDADSTVSPRNAEQVIGAAAGNGARVEVERVDGAGGRASTRRIHRAPDGRALAELWLVHGAPHAWVGGSSRGSYTDARGPDASAHMLRFFLAQTNGAAAVERRAA